MLWVHKRKSTLYGLSKNLWDPFDMIKEYGTADTLWYIRLLFWKSKWNFLDFKNVINYIPDLFCEVSHENLLHMTFPSDMA